MKGIYLYTIFYYMYELNKKKKGNFNLKKKQQ